MQLSLLNSTKSKKIYICSGNAPLNPKKITHYGSLAVFILKTSLTPDEFNCDFLSSSTNASVNSKRQQQPPTPEQTSGEFFEVVKSPAP